MLQGNPTEGTSDRHATCSVQRDDTKVQVHWHTGLSMNFKIEVLNYTIMLNYSRPWTSHDLDRCTSGMLMIGYHAALMGMTMTLGHGTETISFDILQGLEAHHYRIS